MDRCAETTIAKRNAWSTITASASLRFASTRSASLEIRTAVRIENCHGGSPGLVVRGGDSSYEGRGFESQHPILDGHFHIYLLQKL